MRRTDQLLVVAATIILSFITASLFASVSYGFNMGMQDGVESARGVDHVAELFGQAGIFTTITNVLLFIIGAISVIMIIIGGLRYVISGGDSANVTAAKNTILYAIVGVIIAIMGYAIVNFVIASFSPGGGGGSSQGTDV